LSKSRITPLSSAAGQETTSSVDITSLNSLQTSIYGETLQDVQQWKIAAFQRRSH